MIDVSYSADATLLRLEAPPLIDRPQLAQELVAAGLDPVSGTRDGPALVLEFNGRIEPATAVAVVHAHHPTNMAQIDALLAKADNVWNGTDTFTTAQAQKILAGLVLIVGRYLR